MTDPKHTTPETKTVVEKKSYSVLTAVLAVGVIVLAGVIGYGVLTAVDEEPTPSNIDVELETPELPEVQPPSLDVDAPELPEAEAPDLNFDEPEFEKAD